MGRSPHCTDYNQNLHDGYSLPDIITYAKFRVEIFRGYDFTGVEFSIFLLIFEWALQQCAACDIELIFIYVSCLNETSIVSKRQVTRHIWYLL